MEPRSLAEELHRRARRGALVGLAGRRHSPRGAHGSDIRFEGSSGCC